MFEKIKSFLFKNHTARQTVVKNTVWLTVSNFGGRAIKAVIIVYAARALGTAGYGLFSYAVTLAGFFTLFLDPGVNAMLMREIPKQNEEGRREFLSTTFILKLSLVALGVIFIVFVAPFFSTLSGAVALLPLVALMISFDTMREFFSAFMRAREKMEWEAGIFLFMNLVIVIAGFVALHVSNTPLAFAWGYVVGTALGALTATWVMRDYLKGIFSRFSYRLVPPIIRSAWPFAITGALGALLTSADILIISWLLNASAVGIYAAAVRIIQVLYVIPVILQYSTLPLVARLARKDDERLRGIFERTIGTVFLISVPIAIGGIILGTPLMSLIFGADYAAGGLSFKILMATMLFDFPLTIVSSVIFAYDRQKSLIVSAVIAGVGNVILDLILIPRFGIAGSAAATLIAQGFTSWYLWSTMKKINYFEIIPRLGKIALAGIGMGVFTILIYLAHVNVIVNVAASAVVYFLLLKALKEPLANEVLQTMRPRASGEQSFEESL